MSFWRKILLLLVITLAVVAEVCAQSDYARYARYLSEQDSYQRRGEMGLTLGASFMGVEPAVDVISINPKIGVRAAVEYSMVWADDYALQLEVAYISNKADVAMAGKELELRSNVVEVPVLFSYRGLQPVRIGAGVVLSPMASGRYE
ncbi:MAG: outer membrane beta-barrel protein, partial [Alistipes sp.]|nr:outer membrane beta-barrel protein [Alistipes sp.]